MHPNQPTPILFVITTSDVGGAENILRELVRRLDHAEFAPVVCSLCPPGAAAREIESNGVPVINLGMSANARIGELIRGVRTLAAEIDQREIALVQSFLYRANVLAALASRTARRRPLVVSGQRSLTPLTGRSAAIAARCTRSLVDRIVAVSDEVRDRLQSEEHLAAERIVVIPNGVATDRFTGEGRRAARAELGLAEDSIVVGAVGRLSINKGFCDLVEAVAIARDQDPTLHLVVAGDGAERDRVHQLARERGLGHHVHFLGQRSDPRPVYAACDIYALPSHLEGSPNALLEAMASSRAIVATNVGGIPSILEQGRCGILVEAHRPDALAAALIRLAGDSDMRRTLATAARQRVIDVYDITSTVERHADVYRDLLEKRSAASLRPLAANSRAVGGRPASVGRGEVL